MRYGARLNVGLAVMLLLLLAAIFLLEEEAAPPSPTVLAIEFDDVRTIRIELDDRAPLELERAGDGWRLLAPVTFDADLGRLQNIIAGLGIPAHATYPVAETEPGALGLDPPRARLVVNGEVIEFGDTSPADGRRYVRRGDSIHVVNDLVFFRLGGPVYGWARRQPLPPGTRITRIETDEFTIVRDGENWSLDDGSEADSDALQRVVDAWANALAVEVAATDPEQTDGIAVSIELDSGEVLEFLLRRAESYMVVARPGAQMEYRLPLFGSEGLHTLPAGTD